MFPPGDRPSELAPKCEKFGFNIKGYIQYQHINKSNTPDIRIIGMAVDDNQDLNTAVVQLFTDKLQISDFNNDSIIRCQKLRSRNSTRDKIPAVLIEFRDIILALLLTSSRRSVMEYRAGRISYVSILLPYGFYRINFARAFGIDHVGTLPQVTPLNQSVEIHERNVYRSNAYRRGGYRRNGHRPIAYRPSGYMPNAYMPNSYGSYGYRPNLYGASLDIMGAGGSLISGSGDGGRSNVHFR
ncbi:hypothetical protein FQR65_LT18520 [Abscondita terminalis]|nr:hypothetical protein FQR65_LT18520 [Abscondita terminalis]